MVLLLFVTIGCVTAPVVGWLVTVGGAAVSTVGAVGAVAFT